MKKYKLLQYYPSLPKWVEDGNDYWYKDGYIFNEDKTSSAYVSKEEISNSNFWQEKIKTADGFYIDEDKEFVWHVFDNFTKVEMPTAFVEGKFKVFKHESNADEYILHHKKLFSIKDISELFDFDTDKYEELKQLAKERI